MGLLSGVSYENESHIQVNNYYESRGTLRGHMILLKFFYDLEQQASSIAFKLKDMKVSLMSMHYAAHLSQQLSFYFEFQL